MAELELEARHVLALAALGRTAVFQAGGVWYQEVVVDKEGFTERIADSLCRDYAEALIAEGFATTVVFEGPGVEPQLALYVTERGHELIRVTAADVELALVLEEQILKYREYLSARV